MQFAARLRQERLHRHLSQEALAEMLDVSPRSIVRWEQGRTIPHASIRFRLAKFFSQSVEELFPEGVPASFPLLWTVPFPRNSSFIGREDILSSLHIHLTTSQSVALSGLGGSGKTQVATEYAYRYAHAYEAVFWLAAETPESLLASVQQISNHLCLPERQAAEHAPMVAAVQRWLITHPGWLLIADAVEDLDLLQTVLPPVRSGALLLTTCCQAVSTLALPLELPPMSIAEGTALLLRHAGKLASPVLDKASLYEANSSMFLPAEAVALVQLLQGLPLALDQAGAYIEETGCRIEDYLHLYRDQRKQLLARRGRYGGTHGAPVSMTLGLAVERVEREHPLAIDLLRLCTFLHAEAIPEELLQIGVACRAPDTSPISIDAYQFDQALAALRSASLVTRQAETRMLSVHRLVQMVLQDQMQPENRRWWSERVIWALNAVFPDGAFETWIRCERYIPHILACLPLISQQERATAEAGELLLKTGSYLLGRGRHEEARPLLEQAIALEEQRDAPDPHVLIPRLVKWAEWCWRQGEYEATERLAQQALELGKRTLGSAHPQIAEALHELGFLAWYQGDYSRAEPLYEQALYLCEQQSGSEHSRTAIIRRSLANLYRDQERYEQAEPLYQLVLQMQEHQLGAEHPQIALTLDALATLYRQQRHYQQAERLYRQALRMQEHHLGQDHPETTLPLSGLARLAQCQGQNELAARLYQRALSIREHQLGSKHPWVLSLRHTLTEVKGQAQA